MRWVVVLVVFRVRKSAILNIHSTWRSEGSSLCFFEGWAAFLLFPKLPQLLAAAWRRVSVVFPFSFGVLNCWYTVDSGEVVICLSKKNRRIVLWLSRSERSFAMEQPPNTVFVGQVPRDLPESELRSVMEECGRVVSVNMLTDRTTGQFKGMQVFVVLLERHFLSCLSSPF